MKKQNERAVSEVYPSLFHYTSDVGLRGILSSKSLWATYFRFTNDDEELSTFMRAAMYYFSFKKEVSEKEEEDIRKDFKEQLTQRLGSFEGIAPPYLTCFCAPKKYSEKKKEERLEYEYHNGRLSQWRGYAKDGGYAISFKSEVLEKMLAKEAENALYYTSVHFSSVVYYGETEKEGWLTRDNDEETTTAMHQSLIELIRLEVEGAQKSECKKFLKSEEGEEFIEEYFRTFLDCTTRIKHFGFHEEDEVRIIAPAGTKTLHDDAKKELSNDTPEIKNIRFRDDNTPYITLFEDESFDKMFIDAVESIIIGPGSFQERRKKSVEMLLEKYGFNNIPVYCSEIPYVSR
jgi:hypothetical protein